MGKGSSRPKCPCAMPLPSSEAHGIAATPTAQQQCACRGESWLPLPFPLAPQEVLLTQPLDKLRASCSLQDGAQSSQPRSLGRRRAICGI
jgi:hypothetical protein